MEEAPARTIVRHMNRDALIAAVAEVTGHPRKDVAQVLRASLEHIMRALKRGEEVALVGFGQFSVRTRKPRRGVHPRRPNEALAIPAVKIVKFVAGKRLKESVRSEQ